jgi:hypothetical protein
MWTSFANFFRPQSTPKPEIYLNNLRPPYDVGENNTFFLDINTINSFNAKNNKIHNCYKFTHLIKIRNKKINNNVIIVNNKPTEYMPVLTLSTNTDYSRNLKRDSFAILKFIEDINPLTDSCVEKDSRDEKNSIIHRSILKLAEQSHKLNTTTTSLDTDLLQEHAKLKDITNKFLTGGKNKELNIEIYEYLLKNYPDDDLNLLYTESIESSSDNECGIINYNKSDINKFLENEKIRSCDLIKGNITNLNEPLKPSNNIIYDFKIKFNNGYISSEDLIKFSNKFPAKIKNRIQVINDITYNMNTIEELYKEINIKYIFLQMKAYLTKKYWEDEIQSESDSRTLINIIKPLENEKFIIFGDFHGSFHTFIRHLLRLRKMNVLDDQCNIINNFNLIFLGDIVDRGVYGYELTMLIYALILINPNRIIFNRGNHEEKEMNEQPQYGFKDQIIIQFGDKDGNEIFNEINYVMKLQTSALMIKNPINGKYIYLSHGGIPTSDGYPLEIIEEFVDFDHKENINLLNMFYNQVKKVRWNDLSR